MARDLQSKRLTPAAQEATVRNKNKDFAPHEEIRMVLIGRTGNGKSTSGNTILNSKVFRSAPTAVSVTSECEKARGVVCGYTVAVIDTPGIYDTRYKDDEVFRKLSECISLCAPGPHVFLIVIKVDRFTKEEQETVELLQMTFGDKAADYFMVLFTHGEKLESMSIKEFVSQSQPLSSFLAKCKGRYHVFSNTAPSDTQVPELLAKVRRMVGRNRGTFYTNAMFQEAERLIQEQAERILKANAEQKRREEEKLRGKYEGEKLQEKLNRLDKSYTRKSREKAEKKNKFIVGGVIVTTAEAGAVIGGAAAAAGGPLCMGIGAVVGGVVGAVAGALAPSAVIALKNKCAVQ
ncbi:GTPase IMAP family member 9-like [Toxotes jaculatrix]|uniref:GTPase IMAP family member 9-like n=1 Tax=Toxotes jaculatrix TaxID=941984 RepID=UPI001B3AB98C|nr:GTPase IMAP family member 9-like [Toxotes jaculatrix]